MSRNYHLDHGYITIPTASKIVINKLGIIDDNQSHYVKILNGAKKGWFGGKMHGKRMFQVRKDEIIQYANELEKLETYNLFTYDSLANPEVATF
ncbi:hypothetical protein [Bacillus marasmi]|uniref:hypothetical protein n=1 Tax=Bacillus marasmi TaxID=1926279 RepID=UPI0011C73133|nr:hypothetical protein [Bacillus marasmi]